MKELLRKLCSIDGVSGYEDDVRAFIEKTVAPYADEIITDAVGNLIVFKKGAKRRVRPLMVSAHMDEVGFLVKSITNDGLIKMVGRGMNPAVLIGRHMRVNGKIDGVISLKAIHLTTPEQRKKVPAIDALGLDIGATSKAQAEAMVNIGDPIAPATEFTEFGHDCICAKAIDDRVGCAIMMKLLEEELEYDTYFVFSVCEEVGGSGAGVAARRIDPGVSLVLEGTTCGDVPGTPITTASTEFRKGPAVSIIDRGTIYNRELRNRILAAADAQGLQWQYRRGNNGGTDNAKIHIGASGAQAFGISNPTRYIHSSCNVAYMPDIENGLKLARLFINEVGDCNV